MRKLLICIVLASLALLAQTPRPFNTWRQYAGGSDSSQYSSLNQINKTNVTRLELAWSYPAGPVSFNPLVIDTTMYVLKAGGSAFGSAIVALDATTGKELWTHSNQGGVASRGMNYWESRDRSDRRLVYINAGFIAEIDARTGQTIASFENSRNKRGLSLLDDILDDGFGSPCVVLPMPYKGRSVIFPGIALFFQVARSG